MNKKILSSLSAAAATAVMAGVSAMNAFAEDAAQASSNGQGTAQAPGAMGLGGMFIPLIIMFALLYFIAIRPQKKRQKEEQEMRSSLEIGDEIITIGGIVGKVVTIREEDLIIETGADRNKMKIQRWAVNTNVTKTEQHKKEVEKAREAAKEKKEAKKAEKSDKKSDK